MVRFVLRDECGRATAAGRRSAQWRWLLRTELPSDGGPCRDVLDHRRARVRRQGLPKFGSGVVQTAVHEFAHSYANPLVDKHLDRMLAAGQPHLWHVRGTDATAGLRRRVDDAPGIDGSDMHGQVRRRHAGKSAAGRRRRGKPARGFVWVGDLAKLLEEYEGHRDQFPTFEAFMPKVIDFFNAYAADLKVQERPKVVSMVPANGASDVDPKLTEIRITFSEPMVDKNWAVVGGGPNFPEITGKLAYDKDRKVLTVPVRLKPSWTYHFWLNKGEFNSFRSAKGAILDSVAVEFTTRAR